MSEPRMIEGILFDAGGVLYHRPRQDRHLFAFLEQFGVKPRPRSVVDRALRAAKFDVQTGRISCNDFFDAILRTHGLQDPEILQAGREALQKDAADIEMFPGVWETLMQLQDAGYRLGVVSDTAHTAGQKIAWLAAHRLSPGLWTAFVVSPDVGTTKVEPTIFRVALHQLGVAPLNAAFVGHNSIELACAREMGLATIAFMPDDPSAEVDFEISSFYGLIDLFVG
ncbi:MAG: HAD family hydrolase [Chloroflexi bacterium]|nr:HAD family hydrolase [Chloroflexota bacterium]